MGGRGLPTKAEPAEGGGKVHLVAPYAHPDYGLDPAEAGKYWRGQVVVVTEALPSGPTTGSVTLRAGELLQLVRYENAAGIVRERFAAKAPLYFFAEDDVGVCGYGRVRPSTPDEEAAWRLKSG